MNVQTLSRTAVSGYLRALRAPADAALAVLPGDAETSQSRRLVIDRADATARALAAAVLRDPQLHDDAQRRRAAARERERALSLRGQAQATAEQAQDRLESQEQAAQERRRRAAEQAKERRAAAARERRAKVKEARETEAKRVQGSRAAEDKVKQRIDEREPQARLAAVQAKAQALDEQQAAQAREEEAERLGAAAAAIAQERTSD